MEQRFDESEHPRDEHGRFVSKGYQKIASPKEVKAFLNSTKTAKKHQKISISKVNDTVKADVKNMTGKDVKRIVLDTSSVNHSLKKTEHHISADDIRKIPGIINKNSTVTLETKLHQNNYVLHYQEKKSNGLHILMEVRGGKGDLALVTMYRQKKAK